MNPKILVTGAAGFVGFHVAQRLLSDGAIVLGVDNFNSYYDVALKEARAEWLERHTGFSLTRLDIADKSALGDAWRRFQPEVVIHLAAQAGVRHSIDNPGAYVESNVVGTFNVLELARENPLRHLLAASTSSIYGSNEKMPFCETDRVASPISFYAATKGAAELMGHAYAHLYKTPITFLRFFTVYGPWGRPDMAYFKFTKSILEGRPIHVYNNGDMMRDFTYVSDLVEAIVRLIPIVPGRTPVAPDDSLARGAPVRIVNIGQSEPIALLDFIAALEAALGKSAEKRLLPLQAGDLHASHASTDLLRALTGFVPATPVSTGVSKFVEWYLEYTGSRAEGGTKKIVDREVD